MRRETVGAALWLVVSCLLGGVVGATLAGREVPVVGYPETMLAEHVLATYAAGRKAGFEEVAATRGRLFTLPLGDGGQVDCRCVPPLYPPGTWPVP